MFNSLVQPNSFLGRVRHRLLLQQPVQKILAPFGRELEPDRWVFIVGCYNSGTSLLNKILGSHEELSGLKCEGVVLTDVLKRPEEFGWPRMWFKCFEQVRLTPESGIKKIADRAKRQWSFSFDRQSPNYLEKSVANTARIPFLGAYYKPAFFIYLVRDGYAVAEGIRRKAEPGIWGNCHYSESYPIDLCARQWKLTDKVVECDRKNVNNIITVKYESLVNSPLDTLHKVTRFIGISDIDSSKVEGKWSVGGYRSVIKNMNPHSHKRLSRSDKNKIKKEAAGYLNKYGYVKPKN